MPTLEHTPTLDMEATRRNIDAALARAFAPEKYTDLPQLPPDVVIPDTIAALDPHWERLATRSPEQPVPAKTEKTLRLHRIGLAIGGALLAVGSPALAGCGSLGPSYGGEFYEPAGNYPRRDYEPEPLPPTPHETPEKRTPGFTYTREDWPDNIPAPVILRPSSLSEGTCRRRYRDSPDVEHNPRGARPVIRKPLVFTYDDRCVRTDPSIMGVYPNPDSSEDFAVMLRNGDRVAVAGVVEDGAPVKDTYGGTDKSTVWFQVVVADGTKDGYPGFLPWSVLNYGEIPESFFR